MCRVWNARADFMPRQAGSALAVSRLSCVGCDLPVVASRVSRRAARVPYGVPRH